jgi:hypothetical protein
MIKAMKVNPCAVCEKPVFYQSRMTEHPESPEMILCAEWMGVFEGEDGRTCLVSCCSETCVTAFFARGDADDSET